MLCCKRGFLVFVEEGGGGRERWRRGEVLVWFVVGGESVGFLIRLF